ncbi:MAG: M28 family metallopeptidase, partial [Bacteroidota bacterium]
MSKCAMAGWITNTAAGELFKNSKARKFTNLIEMATQPDFKPIPTGLRYSTTIKNTFKKEMSNNVIAMLEGSEKPEEYLIYTAHWDHLGVGQVVNGDSIYNGALDNASGTATVLAIAQSFAQTKPKRSVVFLLVTAEEQGLLGSRWYAQNPIFPLDQTIANLNKDGANIIGPMKDLTITGYGQSTLDDLAKAEAAKQDRYLTGDPEPEKGYFFRSDHFEFAKVGVPAFYAQGRYEHREKGVEYAQQKADEYTSVNYHQPSDEYSDDWDLSGAVEDAQLYLNMGLRLANEELYPEWKEGSEFKDKRKKLAD